jgi:hypothetical protein
MCALAESCRPGGEQCPAFTGDMLRDAYIAKLAKAGGGDSAGELPLNPLYLFAARSAARDGLRMRAGRSRFVRFAANL